MKYRPSHLFAFAIPAAVALALCALAVVRVSAPVHAANGDPTQPVLVELFTSEGCSSCPPADALLAKLDSEQFVPGAQAIVLSEHVTYWNELGSNSNRWHDPFSSQALTDRQHQYATRFGLDGVYTPQAVVDGAHELVGSDRGALIRAVQSSADKAKIPITIEGIQWSGDKVAAQVTAAAPANATLVAALADDSDRSSVLHGENQGRDLRHVAVVRTLVELRKTAGPLNKLPIQVNLTGPAQPKMRLVVFLTDRGGRVLGTAMQPIPR